jgi:hypothetical protein
VVGMGIRTTVVRTWHAQPFRKTHDLADLSA